MVNNSLTSRGLITAAVVLNLMTFGVGPFGELHGVFAQQSSAADTAPFFDEAHGALVSALEMFDEKKDLPRNRDLAFYDYLSSTKESQQKNVEAYLDVAAESLGISRINERRDRIAELREQIADSRTSIARFQRHRISAPDRTYNPFGVSKGGYDKKIAKEKGRIEKAESAIWESKKELARQLNQIGMKISAKDVDVLLDSITGDEFVRISIIFDNAKNFARELERLTEKSNEDLATAKRYYGVYLMLLHTVDRLQMEFIKTVDDEYYPQLNTYVQQARENIKAARRAAQQGGERKILESNIDSNQITMEVATFYKQSLSTQKYEMMKANEKIKTSILTATNTYKTASLSKDIASLISVSRRAFDSIAGLSVPDLRPFENAKLKGEFSRLAREIQRKR